jgi:methionine-rich copper-binding protein CopC
MRSLLIALVSLAFIATAQAHVGLVTADPEPDSHDHITDNAVVLELTEQVDPALAEVSVVDEKGRNIATGVIRGAMDTTLSVETKSLDPPHAYAGGWYTVMWKVVASDGHESRGSYRFHVHRH